MSTLLHAYTINMRQIKRRLQNCDDEDCDDGYENNAVVMTVMKTMQLLNNNYEYVEYVDEDEN